MLEVTDAAKLVLHSSLVDRDAPPGVAFRLARFPEGTRLKPDRVTPRDTGYGIAGRTVLVVEKQVAREMLDQVLDVVRTDGGDQFLLRQATQGNE